MRAGRACLPRAWLGGRLVHSVVFTGSDSVCGGPAYGTLPPCCAAQTASGPY